MDEFDASSFEVRFLEVDGRPLTVIGPTAAIAALERRLREPPEIEVHRLELEPPEQPEHPPAA
jgi:hypothetical protein